MAQLLSAFESGSTIEKRHRRGPRPSKNSSGGFTKQSEDPIAFGDWHPSLEEAMQQAVRFRMERDAAILDRQHAFDALRDLQAASARLKDCDGPPHNFTKHPDLPGPEDGAPTLALARADGQHAVLGARTSAGAGKPGKARSMRDTGAGHTLAFYRACTLHNPLRRPSSAPESAAPGDGLLT